jgi:hypothetical protein
MVRPRVKDSELFIELQARMEPLKGLVDQAKLEAEFIVKRAKEKVEQEELAIIRSGKMRGLSNYGVSLLTGVTRSDLLVALVDRAMAQGGLSMADLEPKIELLEVDGFAVEPLAPKAERTGFTAPDGTRYTFERDAEGRIIYRDVDGVELPDDVRMERLTFHIEQYASEKAL